VSPLPLSATARVAALVAAAPDSRPRVLHRGRQAAYVDLGGWCVGLVDRAGVHVPNALVGDLTGVDLTVAAIEVRDGSFVIGGTPTRVGRLRDAAVPRLDLPPASPPATGTLTAHEAADLLGRGDGLTPAGDDLLCGWLAVHRAAGRATPEVDAAVRARLHRTTLLSATLLECALAGEAVPQVRAWLRALRTPAERSAARAVLDIGHTSGRALLHGGRRALAELTGSAVAA
jgi:hypothetical protein